MQADWFVVQTQPRALSRIKPEGALACVLLQAAPKPPRGVQA
jgi:hypothetical protein